MRMDVQRMKGWWPWVVVLFKGVAGMVLALGGLLVLSLIRDASS